MYKEYADKLVADGVVYPCFCTDEELEECAPSPKFCIGEASGMLLSIQDAIHKTLEEPGEPPVH